MIDEHDVETNEMARVPSGVPGLDTILQGGFFRGGVYMVLAPPGSGKTILANQMGFEHLKTGGRVLFVTLLTESHSRLLAQLQGFDFFDRQKVGAELIYVTGYQALEKDNLKGLLALLRQTVRDHEATLLVIDGFLTAGAMADSEVDTKRFIHELQAFIELVGCTTLILTGASRTEEPYALRTMVDGLVELRRDAVGMETARSLEVTKFRGGATLPGRHFFEIKESGVHVHPRTESLHFDPCLPFDATDLPLASMGVEELDGMLGGGLRQGSVTMMMGSAGAGKTLLGLTALHNGASQGHPGLYFGFFEPEADLIRKAKGIGFDLAAHVDSGVIRLMCQSPFDSLADALADRLLTAVREQGTQRLFIDGLGGFQDTLIYPDRSRRFFGKLLAELRSLGVAVMVSDESQQLGDVSAPQHRLTALFDSVINLRHVERERKVDRVVSVVKMRDGRGSSHIRNLGIGPNGWLGGDPEAPGAPGGDATAGGTTSRKQ